MTPKPNAQSEASLPPIGKFKPGEQNIFIKRLLEEGSITDGNAPELIQPHDIPWIDYDLLAKGRSFVKSNYAMILLSMMAADTLGMVSKQVASTVFRNFYPSNNCGMRFLSTFRTTMTQWLLSDFSSGATSEFVQSIQRVRKLHKIYANPKIKPTIPPEGIQYPPEYTELVRIIRKDLQDVDTSDYPGDLISWTPSMNFTQLDVALVQFGIAPLLLYPERMGVFTTYEEDEEIRGYFHMWAIIGKMLGLQDCYNLALHPDRDLYRELMRRVGVPSFKMIDESVVFCMYQMLDGVLNRVVPGGVSLKALLYSGFKTVDIEGVELWRSMGIRDKISYHALNLSLFMMQFNVVRIATNFLAWGVLSISSKLYLDKK